MSTPIVTVKPNRFTTHLTEGTTWMSRNGKNVLVAGAVVGGLVVGGALVYSLVAGLVSTTNQFTNPSGSSPGCQALVQELGQVNAQIGVIYAQAAQQGGQFTSGQLTALGSASAGTGLYGQQAQITKAIGNPANCPPPPGVALNDWFDQVLGYAKWIGVAIMATLGFVFTAKAVQWLLQRFPGSRSIPGTPPTAIDDVDTSTGAGTPATFGSDIAGAQTASDVQVGTLTETEAGDIAGNLVSSDPAAEAAFSTGIAEDYAAAATSASSAEAATFFDAISAAWDEAATAIALAWDSFTAFVVTLFA